MRSIKSLFTVALSALVITFAPAALAEQSKQPDRKQLTQMHQDMAKRHGEAAKCLKSGTAVEECNRKAMKGCPMMKTGKCPFMGEEMGMMDHEGMMDHGTMPMDGQKKEEGGKQ